LGWNKSCIDVKVGATVLFHGQNGHGRVQCAPILIAAAVTVYSAPDDGRKGRPKHVEPTCSC